MFTVLFILQPYIIFTVLDSKNILYVHSKITTIKVSKKLIEFLCDRCTN